MSEDTTQTELPESEPHLPEAEAPAPKTPEGRAVKLSPEPIMPGESGQLFHKMTGEADIAGIVIDSGCEIVRVFAGRYIMPAADDKSGDWTGLIGKRIPGGAYVTVVAKNNTDDALVVNGALYLTNEANPPKKAPIVHGAGPGSGARRVTHAAPQSQASRPTGITKPPQGKASPVVPGVNEVAILLKRGNCERVLQLVKGGVPLHESDKPEIIRCLERALGK